MIFLIPILAIIVGFFVLKKVTTGKTNSIISIVYIVYYLSQVVLGLILLFTDPKYSMANSYATTIEESLLPMSSGVILAMFGILFGVRSSRILRTSTPSLGAILNKVEHDFYIERVIFILLFFFSCSILRTFIPGYLINLIANTFNFATIIVGYFWNRINKSVKCYWIIALIITFIFHMIQGSRGYAIFPIIFLLIGQLLSIVGNKKALYRKITVYSIIFILFMPLFAKVQDYRIALGRGVDVSVETFSLMVDYLLSEQIPLSSESETSESLSRFIIGTNFATVSLTPKVVPYRNFDSMGDEILSMVTLVGSDNVESFNASRADLGYGIGVPSKYGFHVTELNSVEFPLFADAYSRFGYLGIFIYFLLFSFLVCKLELFFRRIFYKNSLLCLMLLTFFLYYGTLSYGSSYYALGKSLVFKGVFVVIITHIIAFICSKKKLRNG